MKKFARLSNEVLHFIKKEFTGTILVLRYKKAISSKIHNDKLTNMRISTLQVGFKEYYDEEIYSSRTDRDF